MIEQNKNSQCPNGDNCKAKGQFYQQAVVLFGD